MGELHNIEKLSIAKRQNASLLEFSHGIHQSLWRVLGNVALISPEEGGRGVAKAAMWKKHNALTYTIVMALMQATLPAAQFNQANLKNLHVVPIPAVVVAVVVVAVVVAEAVVVAWAVVEAAISTSAAHQGDGHHRSTGQSGP
jgi:hypothetical protein